MAESMTSTKPYIVRAFYEWISDNQMTPYIAVDVNVYGVSVPLAYVNDGQIILNISIGAVGSISMAGDFIEFSARFGGKLENLIIPYGAISAIYAKENGAGTSLTIEHPIPADDTEVSSKSSLAAVEPEQAGKSSKDKPKGRASLKVVK
jgi:stringent starvation protein B